MCGVFFFFVFFNTVPYLFLGSFTLHTFPVLKPVVHDPQLLRPPLHVKVDAIVNTIGFPLVGGPAGTMEAGRSR